jgi:hypothetical protein
MQLVVQSGAEPGRTYDITASQKIRMGRQSGNDVIVPDEQVSRRHAEIEERNGALVVTDLGSSNGTFVNGTRITSQQPLRSGDTVQVGTTVLKVLDSPSTPGMAQGDYDQGAATAVFQPGGQGQDVGYGSYGSSAAPAPSSPAQPAAPDYGQANYGQGAYGQPPNYEQAQNYQQPGSGYSPAAPAGASYDQAQGGYGQQPASYDQGQPAYGQSQPPASYDQSQGAYGGQQQQQHPPEAAYAQPQTPASYDQGQGAYNQAQGAYGGQAANAYGQQQPGAYPPNAPYGQPPAPVVAAKRGLPLPLLIIGGVVILLIIAAAVYFLVLNKGTASVGGDIPEPKNATKLDITVQDFEKFRQAGDKTDLSKVNFAGYVTADTPAQILSFYRTEMKNRGWTEDTAGADANSTIFTKGSNSAGVATLPVKSSAEVTAYESFFPSLKGKVQAGQTIIFLVSGPSNVVKANS